MWETGHDVSLTSVLRGGGQSKLSAGGGIFSGQLSYLFGKSILIKYRYRIFHRQKLYIKHPVVLISKGKGGFRGIGLVEVIWKHLTIILHRRLTMGITLTMRSEERRQCDILISH